MCGRQNLLRGSGETLEDYPENRGDGRPHYHQTLALARASTNGV